jgi:flagellar motor switch protein FliM
MSAPDVAENDIENAQTFVPGDEDLPAPLPFQFSAASALTKARQESLESWHRKFLGLAAGSLGDLLRLDLNLELVSVQIQTYGDMVQERDGENECILFRMHPQPGIWLLDLPVSLSLLIVDRMMGGPGVLAAGETRELTELDQVIFQQFAETLLADYARNWRPHAELKAEVLRQVRNLNYQLIHQPEELILRVGIQVEFKGSKSIMWMVAPIISVEDLLSRSLASDDRVKKEDEALADKKKSPMGFVPVPVSIRWQGFQMTLREVEAMSPGDVLVLDNRKCETAAVWLGDRAKFSGRVSREAQKTTLTITGHLESIMQTEVLQTPSRDLVMDIPVSLSVELGQTQLEVRDVLNLGAGSVIELNKLQEEPVDVRINGRLIARGEIVLVKNNLAVKITELIN